MKQHAPPTQRNRGPILEVLRQVLPATGVVLEIASGSGEHAVYFSGELPHLTWQPSDADPRALESIAAWRAEAGHPNLLAPVRVDVREDRWPVSRADAIVCINMVHISPWESTRALMRGAGRVLTPGGVLYLYGPYLQAGVATAPSNLAFDASLKERNSEWGLRDLDAVCAEAGTHGLVRERVIGMPSNNLSVVFRREVVPDRR